MIYFILKTIYGGSVVKGQHLFFQQMSCFYCYIDIKTNKLGWVKSFAIKKIKDIPLSSSSGFQESGTSSSYDTEVEITNKSSSTISLIVGNNYFSLEPHSTTTEITENGVLYYTASAPGVIPSSGKYKFEQGHKYNWTFTIVTRRR